ncbi:MAG TPA: uroporphyrinogen-III C-methyltransferase [Caulobacteraceae bacterium]|nr:uroporphyrinogen-III C-methyltransferase [Caulobacteraceae bacterium]
MTSRADRDRDGRLAVFDGGARAPARAGKVWLVGAGPGDPDLLTLKAARVLAAAEVVVHDRLVPEAILALAAPTARMIHVGKRKSHHSVPQDGINELLVALAGQGFQVVRLKGGDPFVFGRGGEEMLACRAAGVEIEVVAGLTAGMAASAAAGAPLTHRGLAQAVTFVTGHAAPKAGDAWGEPDLDWTFLARPNHTVVVYMGLSTAPLIAARLAAAGRGLQTPVLLVENVSRANERRVLATLDGLAEAAADLDGPTILIIGEVAALAEVQGVVEAAADNPWKCA